MNRPEATQAALDILRTGEHFQWYVITLLALVVYVYLNEISKKNWKRIIQITTKKFDDPQEHIRLNCASVLSAISGTEAISRATLGLPSMIVLDEVETSNQLLLPAHDVRNPRLLVGVFLCLFRILLENLLRNLPYC